MIRAFVNERAVEVPDGATVADAVSAFDPALLRRLAAGQAHVTDARGIEILRTAPVPAGTILRVVISARGRADADA